MRYCGDSSASRPTCSTPSTATWRCARRIPAGSSMPCDATAARTPRRSWTPTMHTRHCGCGSTACGPPSRRWRASSMPPVSRLIATRSRRMRSGCRHRPTSARCRALPRVASRFRTPRLSSPSTCSRRRPANASSTRAPRRAARRATSSSARRTPPRSPRWTSRRRGWSACARTSRGWGCRPRSRSPMSPLSVTGGMGAPTIVCCSTCRARPRA